MVWSALWRFKNSAGRPLAFTTQRRKSVVVGEEESPRGNSRRSVKHSKGSVKPNYRLCFILFSPSVLSRFCLANMACGATLKRSMEFEALLSPQSPKRRRCNPLPGTPSAPSPQRCNLRTPVDSPAHSMSPQPIGGEHRLTPGINLNWIWRVFFFFFLRFGVGVNGGGGLGGVKWKESEWGLEAKR